MFFELDPKLVDSKLIDEQLRLLQEAGLRRIFVVLVRNASVMIVLVTTTPGRIPRTLLHCLGTSPNVLRPPQFNGQFIPERNTGPSSSWSAGPASAWAPSIKPTAAAAAAASPGANRSSANAPQAKPRTGSVSSGTFPTSSSPHTPFSEAKRTCKQQEFAESQQEQFRRTQEKLGAERQLKSAGRLLCREELQRVFEHHEKL